MTEQKWQNITKIDKKWFKKNPFCFLKLASLAILLTWTICLWGKASTLTRPKALWRWGGCWPARWPLGVFGRQNTSPFLLWKKSYFSGLSRTCWGAPLAGDKVGWFCTLVDIRMANTDRGDNSRLSKILAKECGSDSNTKSVPKSCSSKFSKEFILTFVFKTVAASICFENQ